MAAAWARFCGWLILLLLSGCTTSPKTIGVGARVVNTMAGAEIVHASFNGQAIGGSGGEECCISLPAQWRPGMTATIEWVKDPSPGVNPGGRRAPSWNPDGTTPPEWHHWLKEHQANYVRHWLTLPVPAYEDTCGLSLVFLPCDEVYPLIDCRQRQQVFSGLREKTSAEWRQELARRLGARMRCDAPAESGKGGW
ncbi:DUF3304 domain-containing protein [Chromobacterium aquaticum]|uniref:DUF3304 domain-containing protein n=1 Tax=Chromobacterium aquaticum TaxID=467180 RepID=A0ABV8ZXN1_9NEIS|nr:DUF3304 domain-containing protein [Chromobacterium aquaticum]MCD5364073.1 DUF3304 domain-containing protein [Chromobacterium aquaticum]